MYHHFIFIPEYASAMAEANQAAKERAERGEAPLPFTEELTFFQRIMFALMGAATVAVAGGVVYLALNR